MRIEFEPPRDSKGQKRSFIQAELLPCPFCGHGPGHEHGGPVYERMGSSRHSSIIKCEYCGCTLESNETDWTSGWKWNRRYYDNEKTT